MDMSFEYQDVCMSRQTLDGSVARAYKDRKFISDRAADSGPGTAWITAADLRLTGPGSNVRAGAAHAPSSRAGGRHRGPGPQERPRSKTRSQWRHGRCSDKES